MSARHFDHQGNRIPSGRQLPRTPPHVDVVRHLNFCVEDHEDQEEPPQNMAGGSRGQSNTDEKGMFDFNTPETKTENTPEPSYPDSMLRGMKGYQPLPGDLDFIKKMKEEKLMGKLQEDLGEVQRLLKKEKMALKLACASRDVAHAELNKFPSCDELAEWVTVVLRMTSPLLDLTDLDAKSLLAAVTEKNVRRATDEKRVELARLEKMVEDKRKEESKEKGRLEKRIASKQLKIQGMMNQLSVLKCELAQEEMQIKSRREIKEKEAAETTSEELQGSNHRQERNKKKLQDKKNQSKPTRSKRTDNQATLKEDRASKNTNETPSATKQTRQKSEDKSVKAAKAPQKKVGEQEEPVQAVRGSRKPTAATHAAPPSKIQSKVKPVEAQSASQPAAPSRSRTKAAAAPSDAGEKAQNTGLRRSKRIASRS
nr:PREDICTED: uncharacterized protein LOC109640227 [Paralichthys olivaceus]